MYGMIMYFILLNGYNGKSIGEVRDFEELNVQEFTNVANAFSMKLNYKKMWN